MYCPVCNSHVIVTLALTTERQLFNGSIMLVVGSQTVAMCSGCTFVTAIDSDGSLTDIGNRFLTTAHLEAPFIPGFVPRPLLGVTPGALFHGKVGDES